MSRQKKENWTRSSFTMRDEHVDMIGELIKHGMFTNLSEIVRYGIEKAYNEKFSETENLLRTKKHDLKKELEQVEVKLRSIERNNNGKKISVLERYKARRDSLSPVGISNYEATSKSWIERNLDDVSEAFSHTDVNKLYEELEEELEKMHK